MSPLVGIGLTISLGVATLAPALTGGAAQAAPTPDCATAFPVASLTEGQLVNGRTVSMGTTPEQFDGEVLGVLESGIAPGLDMIMMELDSPAIQKAGGIWQGMSGSPVYDDTTGDLIGAVAYGLSWGSSPIAGVTPFEDMDDYLEAPMMARKVDVPRSAARAIAATGEVTVAQAEQGFRHLPVPASISGVRADRLSDGENRPYINRNAVAVSSANPAAASEDTLVAGGNLAAVRSVGDVTSAGVGTVTSVCNGRLVGFGHPMSFSGDTSYGMAAASAIYVQPESLGAPFKVANIGELGGTITDDRLAGISGVLGTVPATVPFTSDLTFGAKNRVGNTDVLTPDALASIAFYGALGNHDRVVDAATDGSETQEWLIEGTGPNGAPFAIEYDDRYQSSYDIAYEASYDLADVLWILTGIQGVEIASVTSTATVSEDSDRYTVRKVEQKVGGKWVKLSRKAAKVKPGSTLRLRMSLVSGASTKLVPLSVAIPKRLAGTGGRITLIGGNDMWSDVYEEDTLAGVIDLLESQARNDQVQASIRIGRGGKKLNKTVLTAPKDLVVNGYKSVPVIVGK